MGWSKKKRHLLADRLPVRVSDGDHEQTLLCRFVSRSADHPVSYRSRLLSSLQGSITNVQDETPQYRDIAHWQILCPGGGFDLC
jgi:hypothetical protein